MNCKALPRAATMKSETIYSLCVMNTLTALASVWINFCFIAGTLSNTTLITCTNLFVISLSISDFLVGLITQPLLIWHMLLSAGGIESCVVEDLTAMTLSAFCAASGLCLPLISLDRYIRMKSLYFYTSIVKKKRVIFALLLSWIIAFIIALFSMFVVSKTVFYSILIACWIAVTIIMVNAYFSVIRNSRRKVGLVNQNKTITEMSGSAASTSVSKDKVKLLTEDARQVKLTVTVSIIVAVVVVAWLPTFIVFLLWAIWMPASNGNETIVSLSYALCTFSLAASTVNPLLYGWRIKKLRRAAFEFFLKLIRCYRPNQS